VTTNPLAMLTERFLLIARQKQSAEYKMEYKELIDSMILHICLFRGEGSETQALSCNANAYGAIDRVFAALTVGPCRSGQPSFVKLDSFNIGSLCGTR